MYAYSYIFYFYSITSCITLYVHDIHLYHNNTNISNPTSIKQKKIQNKNNKNKNQIIRKYVINLYIVIFPFSIKLTVAIDKHSQNTKPTQTWIKSFGYLLVKYLAIFTSCQISGPLLIKPIHHCPQDISFLGQQSISSSFFLSMASIVDQLIT